VVDMIGGATLSNDRGWPVKECSTPPDRPVRWRVVFPGHHCAVSRPELWRQTAYGARQEAARRFGLDPERCEVEVVDA
jgi:hypothetical protein